MIRDEQLLEYALGVLTPEAGREVERAAASDATLRADLQRIQDELLTLHDAEAVSEAPAESPPGGRARLLSALEGPSAFLPFLDELTGLFDLDDERMMEVLAMADRSDFEETGVPGVRFLHFAPGPALAGAEAGLVRFDSGACFPEHRHKGRELTYVLKGTLHFSDGTVLGPGDQALLEGGQHTARAGDQDVLYLTFHEGFDVLESP